MLSTRRFVLTSLARLLLAAGLTVGLVPEAAVPAETLQNLASGVKKTCKLLKRAELENALELDLTKGKSPSKRLTGNCAWRVKGSTDYVQLAVLPGLAADELDKVRESFTDVEQVAGIGDDAYFAPSGGLLLVFDGDDALELGAVFFGITGTQEVPQGAELLGPFKDLAQKALERR